MTVGLVRYEGGTAFDGRGRSSLFAVSTLRSSRSFTMIVFEQASQPFTTPNGSSRFSRGLDRHDQFIAQPLVIPLPVIMDYELIDGCS